MKTSLHAIFYKGQTAGLTWSATKIKLLLQIPVNKGIRLQSYCVVYTNEIAGLVKEADVYLSFK